MNRWLVTAAVGGVLLACSASGSSGGYLDAGLDGSEPEVDAGVQVEASTKTDSGKKDATTTPTGPIVVKNLSYGGTSVSNMDVTFSLTGSPDIERLSGIEFKFDGDTDTAKISVACTETPWTSPTSAVQTLKFSYSSTYVYSVSYTCTNLDSATTAYSSSFGVNFGSALTVTFKGLLQDATPWSVAATGAKR